MKLTIAPDGPVASAVVFCAFRAGGVVSRTRTRKLPETVLPPESVAEQSTLTPDENQPVIGKVLPEAGEQMTGIGPSIRSVAVAEKLTAAPAGLVASAVMSPGRLKTGGESYTVIVKLPAVVCPPESVTEQSTVVSPMGKVPDVSEQVGVSGPSITSVAVTTIVTMRINFAGSFM